MKRAAVLLCALAIAVVLWVFPLAWFRAPGPNDAIALSDLEMPVVVAVLGGSVALLVVGVQPHWGSGAPAALGTFLIGVAAAFVISLMAFGNLSDDRFMGLLFLPLPFALVGIAVLAGALAQRGQAKLSGVFIGGTAAAVFLVWLLARGGRDWLLAPYAFDVVLLIALESALVYWIGAAYLNPAPGFRSASQQDPAARRQS